jgi:hypothetical protein
VLDVLAGPPVSYQISGHLGEAHHLSSSLAASRPASVVIFAPRNSSLKRRSN